MAAGDPSLRREREELLLEVRLFARKKEAARSILTRKEKRR